MNWIKQIIGKLFKGTAKTVPHGNSRYAIVLCYPMGGGEILMSQLFSTEEQATIKLMEYNNGKNRNEHVYAKEVVELKPIE